jgi:hypothetical protein
MGCGLWIYKANENCAVKQVPYSRFSRFIFDPDYAAFSDCPNAIIRLIEMSILFEDRKVKAIYRVYFPTYKTTKTGSLDQDHTNAKVMGISEAFPGFKVPTPKRREGGIVDAEAVFAHKRYVDRFMWKPSEAIMNEAQRLFAERSGMNIPWHKWPGVDDLKFKR